MVVHTLLSNPSELEASDAGILAAGKFSVFGELLSQPSRLPPNAAVDATIGQMVAMGLATSATVLCTNLLRSAAKYDSPCPSPFLTQIIPLGHSCLCRHSLS